MEIKIVEESKNRIVFDIVGEGHGFCSMLKDELWKDEDVKVAAYKIEHPLKGVPRFIVESKSDVRKTIEKAVKRLKTKVERLKKEVKKI